MMKYIIQHVAHEHGRTATFMPRPLDVLSDDLIDGYFALKMHEVTRLRMSTHPVGFDMSYSTYPGFILAPVAPDRCSDSARANRVQ